MLALVGCTSEALPTIDVSVDQPAERWRLEPRSSLAEYIEVPGAGTELRVTLASYEASCEKFVAPDDEGVLLSVVVVTPKGTPLTPAEYAWAGHPAHGGTPDRPEKAYAAPSLRVGKRGYRIQPGGSMRLTQLDLSGEGGVAGTLAFEFAGEAERPASSIRGAFRARLCRVEKSSTPPAR